MNIFQIGQLTSDPSKSFEFAIKLGLVSTKPKNCPKCNYQMRLEKGKIRHGLNIRWACGKKACRYKTSVFTNTIFHATHLQIGDVLRILYCFAIGCSLTNTTQYTDLNKKTVSGWFKFFRRILILEYASKNTEMIGGEGCTVEIDETHIYKRKYGVGRILLAESVWVIGGVCRETNKVFLTVSIRRDCESLQNIITKFVKPGSRIITDCWRGYKDLDVFGYRHRQINHSYNFIDPTDTTVHTQRIERVWRTLRNEIPRTVKGEYKKDYLIKHLFFKNSNIVENKDKFIKMVETIKKYFRGEYILDESALDINDSIMISNLFD